MATFFLLGLAFFLVEKQKELRFPQGPFGLTRDYILYNEGIGVLAPLCWGTSSDVLGSRLRPTINEPLGAYLVREGVSSKATQFLGEPR